jgi:hypothetical protein
MNFILLTGKNPPTHLAEFHEIAFNFWYDNWLDFFKKHDAGYRLNPDDFFRQDYVGLLVQDNVPIAIHLYSIFDITLTHQLKQSYCFDNFTSSFFKNLCQKGIKNTISFESMMVSPDFRKTEKGRSIAPLLYAAGIQLVKSLDDVDAMMAPARNDIGVTKLAQSGGCVTVEEHELHGFPVSLIVGKKADLHLGFLNDFDRKLAEKIFNNESNIQLINQSQINKIFFKRVS